ncbi:MAG: ATP synthase F1 subunit delta [Bacteroidetes bacterium]|nr:MAG: ATP synthase F1 subunit delta [Bacteroidota bacterium]
MLNPKLAARYAKSLIDLAQQDNLLEEVFADMTLIQRTCKNNPELVRVLKSPIIKADKKESILHAIFDASVTRHTALFIGLLARKGRENVLDEISNAFADQYRAIKGIVKVKLTTATPVTAELQGYLMAQLKTTFPDVNSFELDASIDEELIGGYKLETDNILVDVSIAKGLNAVSRQFKNNDYIYNIR